jgi:hypothetical protein
MTSPYLDRPLLPLAVALPQMLEKIEVETRHGGTGREVAPPPTCRADPQSARTNSARHSDRLRVVNPATAGRFKCGRAAIRKMAAGLSQTYNARRHRRHRASATVSVCFPPEDDCAGFAERAIDRRRPDHQYLVRTGT